MGSRAEEIARELGRIRSEAAAAEAEAAAEASTTEGELVPMELFNGTGRSNGTASWFGEADPQRDKAAAQAAFEQRGGERTETAESVERIDRTEGAP